MRAPTAALLIAALLAQPALAQAPARPAPAPAAPAPTPAPAPAAQAPSAPPAAQAPAPERSWAVACTEATPAAPRDCRLSAAVVVQPGNQRIAQVILTRQAETRSLALVVQLPHGTWLPGGLTWQLDEAEPQRIPFQSSDAEGVYAGLPVSDDLLAMLRRGGTLRLAFVAGPRREALTLPVPLTQFPAAVAEFFAAERAAPR